MGEEVFPVEVAGAVVETSIRLQDVVVTVGKERAAWNRKVKALQSQILALQKEVIALKAEVENRKA